MHYTNDSQINLVLLLKTLKMYLPAEQLKQFSGKFSKYSVTFV